MKCGKIHEGQRVERALVRRLNARGSEGEKRVGQRVKCVWVKDAASFLHRSQNEA